MFQSIKQLVFGTSDDVSTWLEWQKAQPHFHLIKSEIYEYYLTKRPAFAKEKTVIPSSEMVYLNHCFGNFTGLIRRSLEGTSLLNYLILLLDFYDICKGYSRRFTGDPAGIVLLRQVLLRRNVNILNSHDFKQYNYDYTLIHGHTITQFSLSNFLLFLVSNYMYGITLNSNFPHIDIEKCKKAYNYYVNHDKRLSNNTDNLSLLIEPARLRSESIAISHNGINTGNNVNNVKASSFVESAKFHRCPFCLRITENEWGNFKACIDCYLYRICVACSSPSNGMGSDNLPRCAKCLDI